MHPRRPDRVDDPADPRLADYRALKDPARAAREDERQVFVAEGRLAVGALLASGYEAVSLLVDDRRAESAAGLVDRAGAAGAAVYLASPAVVAATVGFDLHRGIVAVGRRPGPSRAQDVVDAARAGAAGRGERAVVVVAEGLNDHENLGALFRNAAAFGAGGVLLDPRCADPLYRRCVRVSLGHVLAVPFARVEPWPDGLSELRSAGFAVAALAPRDRDGVAAVTVRTFAVAHATTPAVALLAGAEGPGLTPGAVASADGVVTIPMADGVDSLNVATAVAVALHELAEAWRVSRRDRVG